MSRDSTAKLLGVALLLCLVCSVLVSVSAVGLKSRQEENRQSEKKRNILLIARIYDPARSVEEQFSRVQMKSVDLAAGRFAEGSVAGREINQAIPSDRDTAGIRSRSRFAEVYIVEEKGKLLQMILPVYGKGLWSTMYGFIALGGDLSTVTGFGFYEHGETPGLGGEIDNPLWLAKWPGKKIYDSSGKLRLDVVKGVVDTTVTGSEHRIDGISGATLTVRGVGNLISYWLGDDGYKPFLNNLRKESAGVAP